MRTVRTAALLLVAATLGGCALARPSVPAPPGDIAVPVVPDSPDDRLRDAAEAISWELPPPVFPPTGELDVILHSPTIMEPAFRERVEYWLGVWQRGEAERVPLYLERMALYQDLVDEALEAHGLPSSLRYLPFLESGYSPRAVSRASAVGLWQFMAPTASDMRLVVSPLVDERRDPVRSTLAAAAFLTQLHGRFGSWFLALAAYNGGPTRVARLLAEHAPDAEPSDDLYLVIGPYLPAETREFVARFLAGAWIAMDPESYGFATPVGIEPFAWDEVVVSEAASMDVLALAAGTTEEAMRLLNPHLIRGMTLPGTGTAVRVPPGSAGAFRERWARIPPEARVTITEHRVASGETLTHIARAYGVSLAELQAANSGVDPRRLRIGQALVVPVAPVAAAGLARAALADEDGDANDGGSSVEEIRVHVVLAGDTLWDIARRYAVGVEDLVRWNALSEGRLIRPGQRLRVGPGEGS